MDDPAALLGPGGPIARRLPRFQPRPQQQEMAAAVAHAIAHGETLVMEAGTGTGKTFAYLVPALASGARVIVSTGTRTLQDQLYHKDLPLVREALAAPARTALLKGRANYLCPQRLERHLAEGRLPDLQQARQLQRIHAWARATTTGDIAELADIPEDAPVWSLATSTSDNCLGTDCPHLGDCPLAHARQAAQEADLVVVNHHLLLSDLALKEEGFGRLLPAADAVILDEAHQLPDTAGHFFGLALGSRQLEELARDAEGAAEAEAADTLDDYRARRAELGQALDELRGRLPEPGRHPGRALPEGALEALRPPLERLHARLETDAPRGPALAACQRRAEQHLAALRQLAQPTPPDRVRWLETRPRSFTVHQTPLDVGPDFRRAMEEHPGAWIFTSATLAVGGEFDHFQRRLGLEGARCLAWESPFDYRHNALLLVPEGLPLPNDPGHTRAVVEAAVPLIEAAGGRTFLLFTSHRALQSAAALLRERLDLPLLVQGEGARGHLLSRFRREPASVLLGTGSFWEGVDVQGAGLSCVVIDKLPFAAPGDPVTQARIDALREAGEDPFTGYQLPQAVTALRQGVGRLIRGPEDRGVLAICDPRLVERGYGHVFLDSLPPMARTRRLAVATAFLRHHLETA